MNYQNEHLLPELKSLLAERSFRPNLGAMWSGEHLAVQCVPSPLGLVRMCNLEVRIMPYAPDASLPTELRAAQEEAYREAVSDPNPFVREAAWNGLNTLDHPAVPLAALAGIEMELIQTVRRRKDDGNNRSVKLRQTTDMDGRVTFKYVLMDSPCTLVVIARNVGKSDPKGKVTTQPGRPNSLPSSALSQADANASAAPFRSRSVFVFLPPRLRQITPRGRDLSEPAFPGELLSSSPKKESAFSCAPTEVGPLTPVKYFSDPRLSAEIASDANGHLWLTVHTSEPELAEATVRFRCTRSKLERGELRLIRTSNGWQGACRLDLAIPQLNQFEPEFSIEPLLDPPTI